MAGNLSFEEFAAASPCRDPADRKKLLFIYRALEDLAAERRGWVADFAILETACGTGAITLSLARTGARVRAFDTDARDVGALGAAAARAGFDNVTAAFGDASALRTAERFDVVVAGDMDRAPDPDALLANVVRHLAPGGLVIVIASNGYGRWERGGASGRGSKPRHRRFTHGKLVTLLQRNGLDVHRLTNAAFLSAMSP
ncbi:MAG TPA: methyltransferase domain-containing protein, partial [Candidatus Krumholzibacteria bacterium]|nr:methyltransferase domain-containing protein [Candidatus Krumholzibacteria bacterium]